MGKVSRRKEITKIIEEINEIEISKTEKKMKLSWFFKTKLTNHQPDLPRKKERTKIIKIINERRDTNITDKQLTLEQQV